jgi:hypothetical protein
MDPLERRPYETWAGHPRGADILIQHTEHLIREAKAEAWDEGYEAGNEDGSSIVPEWRGDHDNPYRD